MTDRLLTPEEVGGMLGDISVKTLADWRYRGIGPAYSKIGRRVRYEESAVKAYIKAQRRSGGKRAAA